MEDIDYCTSCNHYDCEPHLEPCVSCRIQHVGEPTKFKAKPKTNADRIRAMSDEELAKVLDAFTAYFDECNRSVDEIDCHNCELCSLCSLGEGKAIKWLKQPAEGE